MVYSIKDKIYSLEDGSAISLGRLLPKFSPLNLVPPLVDRLLRNEISHYRVLGDGTELAVYRRRFFVRRPGVRDFETVHALERGSRPLVISVENNDQVVFGEYGRLPYDQPVRIYAASARDFRFRPVQEFTPGAVKHVHGIVWDPYDRCYWVTVGDSDSESGILRMSADFRSMEWLVKGRQEARAVGLMVFRKHIVYGMDSERAHNHIMHLDKSTGKLSKLQSVEGSCLFCARLADGLMAIATACEPSRVNLSRTCHIYVGRDGFHWTRAASLLKDRWSAKYFQFGTFVLPHCEDASFLAYGCQALQGSHGQFAILSMQACPWSNQ